jgi:hypothetical protein
LQPSKPTLKKNLGTDVSEVKTAGAQKQCEMQKRPYILREMIRPASSSDQLNQDDAIDVHPPDR